MSFNSQSVRTSSTAAPTQKRQRLFGGDLLIAGRRGWRSAGLQPPLIAILVELQSNLGQDLLQLVGGAEVVEVKVGAVGLERTNRDLLYRRHRGQPLADLHPVA